MKKYTIGIDVGLKGGIAVLQEDKVIECLPYSDFTLLFILGKYGEYAITFIENQHGFPNQSSVSVFNFGASFGYIRGVCEALLCAYIYVNPQQWKKYYGVTKDKQTSIAKCKELFPDTSLLATDRSRTDHDGMAEALLIAYYGYKTGGKK